MRGFLLLTLTFLLFTTIKTFPTSSRESKHKTTKDPVLKKTSDFQAVAQVKSKTDAFQFLTELGYNPCSKHTDSEQDKENRSPCQTSLPSMLQQFQTTYRLPVTEKLDTATLKLMNTPRCGLSDDYPSETIDRSELW